ncbi:hypothetical protein BVX95_00475 [archaeon D22]|nr:hypothetical protein BVX95_00475 [archaeon D22]
MGIIFACVNDTQDCIDYTKNVAVNLNGEGLEVNTESFKAGMFSGGEFDPRFLQNITEDKIFIFAFNSKEVFPGDLRSRIIDTAYAAYSNGANEVHLVVPNLSYSRADRDVSYYDKDSTHYNNLFGRGAIAKCQADNFKGAGIKSVFTMDVHSDIVQNYYESIGIRFHNIAQDEVFLDYVKEMDNAVLLAVDLGAKDKITKLKEMTGLSAIFLEKIRKSPNNPDELLISVAGKSDDFTGLKGKTLLIPDDGVDTGGTFKKACDTIMAKGIDGEVPKNVIGMFTHFWAILNPSKTLDRFKDDKIVLTNTIPLVKGFENDNITVLKTEGLIAKRIIEKELVKEIIV